MRTLVGWAWALFRPQREYDATTYAHRFAAEPLAMKERIYAAAMAIPKSERVVFEIGRRTGRKARYPSAR